MAATPPRRGAATSKPAGSAAGDAAPKAGETGQAAKADHPAEIAPSEQPKTAPDGGPRRLAIGVDVGGSGIKVAAVDIDRGTFATPRHRVPTPQPSEPNAVVDVITRLVRNVVRQGKLAADVPVGVGVPSVVLDGMTKTAANIDPGWVDFPIEDRLARALKRPVEIVNDADAAGVAEMRFGAGVGQKGTVIVLTLGTGTGSGVFFDGVLVPNTELGHMEIRGKSAEKRSAAAARVKRGLSWKAWAQDLDEHLDAIDRILWPSLFIIGGGVSKRAEKFVPRLTTRPPVVAAQLLNDAGIVGAAEMAYAKANTAQRGV